LRLKSWSALDDVVFLNDIGRVLVLSLCDKHDSHDLLFGFETHKSQLSTMLSAMTAMSVTVTRLLMYSFSTMVSE
jgi:hypothetical protein